MGVRVRMAGALAQEATAVQMRLLNTGSASVPRVAVRWAVVAARLFSHRARSRPSRNRRIHIGRCYRHTHDRDSVSYTHLTLPTSDLV